MDNKPHSTLVVDRLHVTFYRQRQAIRVLRDVSFHVQAGEVFALVGESGSGKSVTALSLMGLLPVTTQIEGSIQLEQRTLPTPSDTQWQTIRGKDIAMIFQDPMSTLHPLLRIDTQMIEAIQAHRSVSRSQALQEAIQALEEVGIADAAQRIRCYPHQLSGGMRQRVVIAIALLHAPKLIIADEPTTALDVTIQTQILSLMQRLVHHRQTALIWISHDLSTVASIADRIAVMYAGQIVEMGSTDAVLDHPQHPYTLGLLDSLPVRTVKGQPLQPIQGFAPNLENIPSGCSFATRCPRYQAPVCDQPPPLSSTPQHYRCFFPTDGGRTHEA